MNLISMKQAYFPLWFPYFISTIRSCTDTLNTLDWSVGLNFKVQVNKRMLLLVSFLLQW